MRVIIWCLATGMTSLCLAAACEVWSINEDIGAVSVVPNQSRGAPLVPAFSVHVVRSDHMSLACDFHLGQITADTTCLVFPGNIAGYSFTA
jgi:hypothetical protein